MDVYAEDQHGILSLLQSIEREEREQNNELQQNFDS